MDHGTGEVFGHLAAQLRRQGRGEAFRVMDLWLAAQAVQRKFRLLTLNERHFKDIPGLNLVVLPRGPASSVSMGL
jgi:predicted nucleic acid-binding protein